MSFIDEQHGKLVEFDGSEFLSLPPNTNYMFGQKLENGVVSNTDYPISRLVGVLHLSSTHSVTTGKKGMIKKPFTSFMKNIPRLQVKTSKTTLSQDEYVIVRIGTDFDYAVEEYIGKVGDTNAELKFLIAIGTCHWTKKNDRHFEKLATSDSTPNRTDLTHLEIYSIDPVGCEDIDDAIHVIKTKSGWEIGIHIADVSSYILEGSQFDIELSKRIESIYPPHETAIKQINMIPDALSIEYISLKEGSPKRAFSMIFEMDENFQVINVQFIKTTIVVKKNLSYEECESFISSTCSLKTMYDVGIELKRKIFNSFSLESIYDCHQMVAVYMIYANMLVAKKIASVNPENVLLRSQQSSGKIIEFPEAIAGSNLDIVERCKMSTMEKAFYKNGIANSGHFGLQLSLYTHFTSPMRRYFDILVHRQLWEAVENKPISKIPTKTLFLLNTYQKNYRQLQRYWTITNIVSNASFKDGSVQEHVGYITSIYDGLCSVRIYIPRLGFEYTSSVINLNFLRTIDISYEAGKVTYKNNDKNFSLSLCQEVKITIAILKNSMEKVCIKISDPDVEKFLFY